MPSLSDFFVWGDVAEKPLPTGAAGAAMLELLERNLLPAFVMDGPWLADLEAQGKNAEAPKRLCWAADDAILLAPYRVSADQWGGFLVAKASASGQVRQFHSDSGESTVLMIPDGAVPRSAFAAAVDGAKLLIAVSREN
ncbi:MAG: hypothetical protein ACO3TI_06425 [Aquiluna sp.]